MVIRTAWTRPASSSASPLDCVNATSLGHARVAHRPARAIWVSPASCLVSCMPRLANGNPLVRWIATSGSLPNTSANSLIRPCPIRKHQRRATSRLLDGSKYLDRILYIARMPLHISLPYVAAPKHVPIDGIPGTKIPFRLHSRPTAQPICWKSCHFLNCPWVLPRPRRHTDRSASLIFGSMAICVFLRKARIVNLKFGKLMHVSCPRVLQHSHFSFNWYGIICPNLSVIFLCNWVQFVACSMFFRGNFNYVYVFSLYFASCLLCFRVSIWHYAFGTLVLWAAKDST